jgi:hypothetical protein
MQINRVKALYLPRFMVAICLLAGAGWAFADEGAAKKATAATVKGNAVAFGLLIDAVRSQGPASSLPPHLSEVLKLNTNGQPTPVKQALMREGDRVHTFNVRSDGQDGVVLMVFDTRTQATRAYLASELGKLRKAVGYQAGEAPTERSIEDARADFIAEVAFWSGLSRKSAGGH